MSGVIAISPGFQLRLRFVSAVPPDKDAGTAEPTPQPYANREFRLYWGSTTVAGKTNENSAIRVGGLAGDVPGGLVELGVTTDGHWNPMFEIPLYRHMAIIPPQRPVPGYQIRIIRDLGWRLANLGYLGHRILGDDFDYEEAAPLQERHVATVKDAVRRYMYIFSNGTQWVGDPPAARNSTSFYETDPTLSDALVSHIKLKHDTGAIGSTTYTAYIGDAASELPPYNPVALYARWQEGLMRPAFVQDRTTSTYLIPGDFPKQLRQWFAGGKYSVHDNSSIETYLDNSRAYTAMQAAIETTNGSDHFVLLLGWSCNLNFPLQGHRGDSMRDVLKSAYNRGVKIRLLLWDNILPVPTSYMTSKVETLTTVNTYPFLEDGHPSDQAVAFVDRDTKAGGSHHQKILMVCGSRGIVGFFGGLDVFDDRVRPTTAIGPFSLVGGSPLFDTHCMVVGDAAADLYKIAKDRFSTCQSSAYPTRSFNEVNLSPVYANATVQFAATPSKVEKAARKHLVRFATTDGRFNGTTKDVWSQLQYAIDRAEQYVYGQDQYFWSLAAAERLNAAAKRGVAVVLLSPADAIAAPGAPGLRRNFVSKLLDGLSPEQANRVCICCRKDMGIALSGTNFDGPGNYVHSKLWIFDDALSIVGSANCNDRGYSHDSEVIGAFTDTESAFDVETNWTAPKTTTARGLRIRLWQQHLCLPRKHVYDAISAILYWRYPRRSGRIENLYGPFLLRAQDPVLDKPIPASDLE